MSKTFKVPREILERAQAIKESSIEDVPEREHTDESIDKPEKTNAFKDVVFHLASLPINEAKRKPLNESLKNDQFLSKYVDRHLSKVLLANQHVNALVLYSYHYSKVKFDKL